MARTKKAAPKTEAKKTVAKKVEVKQEEVEVKTRKAYPSVEERIAMADAKIAQLENLNASREALVQKTAALLAERESTLEKSKVQLEKVQRRRDRLVASKEKPAKQPRARKTVPTEPGYDKLTSYMASQNLSWDDVMNRLADKPQE